MWNTYIYLFRRSDELGIFSGLLGNLSEVSVEELTKQYGVYLMPNETISTGFKLVRDSFIITDERIILIDHQGVTGKKTKVSTIDLDSIYEDPWNLVVLALMTAS